ncbi:ATP synthase subunit G atp20 [Kluyveromyces marxianus]|nr:ATP synthase subunit G atp20 [Kluyveromyces marxianus]KAG0686085.1 ATP synthase subunit G atp20 [Kluyveromyces marxianus]
MLSRLQTYATSLTQKTQLLLSKTVYYGKVTAELSKQVYTKEGLQPSNFSDFEMVYTRLYRQAVHYAERPQQAIEALKNIEKDKAIQIGAVGVQMLGLYSLGEIIGRRKVVGYRNYSTASH